MEMVEMVHHVILQFSALNITHMIMMMRLGCCYGAWVTIADEEDDDDEDDDDEDDDDLMLTMMMMMMISMVMISTMMLGWCNGAWVTIAGDNPTLISTRSHFLATQ